MGYLIEILCLDPASSFAESARGLSRSLEEQLVDDDVVSVDAALRQLLHQPLGLVQGQELGDADAHERRRVGITELLVHLKQKNLISNAEASIRLSSYVISQQGLFLNVLNSSEQT